MVQNDRGISDHGVSCVFSLKWINDRGSVLPCGVKESWNTLPMVSHSLEADGEKAYKGSSLYPSRIRTRDGCKELDTAFVIPRGAFCHPPRHAHLRKWVSELCCLVMLKKAGHVSLRGDCRLVASMWFYGSKVGGQKQMRPNRASLV